MAAPKVVALMPMKAHSARVPAKNWRELHGLPLFAHTLQALLSSHSVAHVYIDTDANLQDSLALHFHGHLDRITVREPKTVAHPRPRSDPALAPRPRCLRDPLTCAGT
jgi:CMP-N-acetylneuraminic acid synthetase